MSLTATVTPGKTFVAAELVTNAKLNQLAAPSVTLSGTADTSEITNNSVTAVKAAYGPWFYCTDGGTANAHDLTAAASATTLPTTLVAGQEFAYTAAATNTGAVTVAISGIGGTVALTKNGSTALDAGDVRSGQLVWVRYDGAQMQLATPNGQPRLDRFATTATSATAYTATFDPTLTALTNGTRVLVKWHATNTSTATFAPDGLTAKAITKAADAALVAGDVVLNQISELVYDSTLDHWLLTSPVTLATRTTVPVQQTVLSCSVASTGLPNYVTFSGQNISFQNCDTTSLVIAFAAGYDSAGAVDYVGVVSTNTSNVWTISVSNATYYLYAERNTSTGAITYGSVATLRPNYTNSSTISTTTDQHTFNINTMKMSVGIAGPSSSVVQRVFLGECVVSGGVLQTPTLYMPRGEFQSGADQTLTAATNQNLTETHRLGLAPRELLWTLICQTADANWAQGDEVNVQALIYDGGASSDVGPWFYRSATICGLLLPWSAAGANPFLINKTTYSMAATITAANWRARCYARRGW